MCIRDSTHTHTRARARAHMRKVHHSHKRQKSDCDRPGGLFAIPASLSPPSDVTSRASSDVTLFQFTDTCLLFRAFPSITDKHNAPHRHSTHQTPRNQRRTFLARQHSQQIRSYNYIKTLSYVLSPKNAVILFTIKKALNHR